MRQNPLKRRREVSGRFSAESLRVVDKMCLVEIAVRERSRCKVGVVAEICHNAVPAQNARQMLGSSPHFGGKLALESAAAYAEFVRDRFDSQSAAGFFEVVERAARFKRNVARHDLEQSILQACPVLSERSGRIQNIREFAFERCRKNVVESQAVAPQRGGNRAEDAVKTAGFKKNEERARCGVAAKRTPCVENTGDAAGRKRTVFPSVVYSTGKLESEHSVYARQNAVSVGRFVVREKRAVDDGL